MSKVMRAEWNSFLWRIARQQAETVHEARRTAFYAGWTRAVQRLSLPEPPEPIPEYEDPVFDIGEDGREGK